MKWLISWKDKITKLSQEKNRNLNRPEMPKEIELVIKYLPAKNSPRPEDLISKFYYTFREDTVSNYTNVFRKKRRRRQFPTCFMRPVLV